jgi:hypothetical protein
MRPRFVSWYIITSGTMVPNVIQVAISRRNVWMFRRGYNRIRNVNAAVTAGLKTSEITEAAFSGVIIFLDAIGEPLRKTLVRLTSQDLALGAHN